MDTERFTFAQMLELATRDRWTFAIELCPHCAIGAVCEDEDGGLCCSWCEAEWEAAESKRGVTPS